MMKLTQFIPFALMLSGGVGGYAYAAESAIVTIEAEVEAVFSVMLSKKMVSLDKELSSGKWAKLDVTTTSNATNGVLVVTGCDGAGDKITLKHDDFTDSLTASVTIGNSAAAFTGGTWKPAITFTNGTNTSSIWIKKDETNGHKAGKYTCNLTIKAQAK
ncbi:hypothetical protein [Serratia marcescens]|uniref:hypothetical protein n=1 Tax=Serratia marcescens TaxID=615 RepID=UPI0013DC2139|nr:hypothetical protein [Serratia marcescens]